MTTKLKGLRLLELSLVDNPANKHAQVSIFKRADGEPPEDKDMPTPAEQISDLEKRLAASEASLATVNSTLNKANTDLAAAQKAATEAAERATKAEGELAEMKKAADIAKADEVFEFEGQTIRKSESGAAVFNVLKAQSERIEIAKAEAQAETMYPNLPGSVAEKGAALRFVNAAAAVAKAGKKDGDKEDDAPAFLHKMLAAGNAALGLGLSEVGKGGNVQVLKGEQALEKMAHEIAKRDNTTFEKAYAAALETPEGKAIYKEMDDERRKRAA